MPYTLKFNTIARNTNRAVHARHTHTQFPSRVIYSATRNISFAVRISCIQIYAPACCALSLKFRHIYSIEWKYFLAHQKIASATFEAECTALRARALARVLTFREDIST